MQIGRANIIEVDNEHALSEAPAFVSIGFSPGARPTSQDVAALADREGGFSVSHQPGGEARWMELLIHGLTFDLRGLSPAAPASEPPVRHRYGIREVRPMEVVAIATGPHVSAGRTMPPVLRAGAMLAVSLSRLDGAELISWHAAANQIGCKAFEQGVTGWLRGGAFPSFSLISIFKGTDGSTCTEGLNLFIGQELRLAHGAAPRDDNRLVVRLVNFLVQRGGLRDPMTWEPDGRTRVRLEPAGQGRTIWAVRID